MKQMNLILLWKFYLLSIGMGCKGKPTANNEYLSSQDTYSTKHSATIHDTNGWRFLSNSTNQTVTTDSVVH